MNYFTGVGGFADNGEGDANFYQGPAGSLLGTIAGFSASVMFSAHANVPAGGTAGFLFGAATGGPPATAGWGIEIDDNDTNMVIRGYSRVTAGLEIATLDDSEALSARPFYVATLVVDPTAGADGATKLYLNAVHLTQEAWAAQDAYVAPAAGTRPSIGARNDGQTESARTAFIMGAGFSTAILNDEQVFRHQLACLEAGDFVDGAGGGAFSAGVPLFSNLYSARRSNNGVGVAEASFIAGLQNNAAVGQVPPAAATWVDLVGAPARDFTRLDLAAPATPCFVAGFKRIG